jgi:di/tricarboxylate transporter
MNARDERPGRAFWIGLAAGWAVMAFGVAGLIANRADTKPFEVTYRFLELAVVHDAVAAPLAYVVGAIATHWLPAIVRGPVRGALALSAIVIVFALPLVQRLGARQNSSVLPLAYGPNLATVLGGIWLATAAVVARRLLKRRRHRWPLVRPELSPERGA